MISLLTIHGAICDFYVISRDSVFSDTKNGGVIKYRQMFHYLARELNNDEIPFQTIGDYYAHITGRSYTHATVRHNWSAVADRIKVYRQIKLEAEYITNICRERSANLEIDLSFMKLKCIDMIMKGQTIDQVIDVTKKTLIELEKFRTFE